MSKCCCFFGHRTIDYTKELENKIYENVKKLIDEENVDTFLFGSRSQFNSLCLDVVSRLKNIYPKIKRIYVRAEYPYINDDYKNYLLEKYEDSYFPEKLLEAGKARYVERNREMIDKSDFCIGYYDENYSLCKQKSGTKIAYQYAIKQKKKIINIKTV